MAKQRGGSKKLRRSRKKEAYYDRYRRQLESKNIRRKGDREKRLRAAKEHPEIGSPSQLRRRGIKVPDVEWRDVPDLTQPNIS